MTARNFVVETVTPNGDEDNNFTTIEEVLHTTLQEKGFGHMGEHGSTVNASLGDVEEAISNEGGDKLRIKRKVEF